MADLMLITDATEKTEGGPPWVKVQCICCDRYGAGYRPLYATTPIDLTCRGCGAIMAVLPPLIVSDRLFVVMREAVKVDRERREQRHADQRIALAESRINREMELIDAAP